MSRVLHKLKGCPVCGGATVKFERRLRNWVPVEDVAICGRGHRYPPERLEG